jgi:hypothetical protein
MKLLEIIITPFTSNLFFFKKLEVGRAFGKKKCTRKSCAFLFFGRLYSLQF